jgi:hypothetical protein
MYTWIDILIWLFCIVGTGFYFLLWYAVSKNKIIIVDKKDRRDKLIADLNKYYETRGGQS